MWWLHDDDDEHLEDTGAADPPARDGEAHRPSDPSVQGAGSGCRLVPGAGQRSRDPDPPRAAPPHRRGRSRAAGLPGSCARRASTAFSSLRAWCSRTSRFVVIAKVGLKAITDLKNTLFRHLLSLPLSFFDQSPPGRLMARVESDAEKVRMLFAEVGLAMLSSMLLIGGGITVMLVTDARIAAVVLGIAAPLCFGTFFFLRYLRKVYAKARAALRQNLELPRRVPCRACRS